MRRIIPLILILMTVIDSGSARCSCYSFDGTSLRSWSGARKLCTDNHGDLVSIETVEEWQFVKTEIQNRVTEPLAFNEWWIGLEMRGEKWEWLSNHTLTYNKWQYGKPDDDKDCIHVIIAKNYPSGTYGLFRNKRDDLKRGSICEYEGQVNCRDDLVGWCDPTKEPPSRSTTTATDITSQTTKIIHTTTETPAPGNNSPVPHHSTSSTNGPVEDSRQSFPTAVVGGVIGALLLITCVVIIACIWKRRKKERKPRMNSHLSKKSRVPVKLEHSSSSNTNDVIKSSDVTIVSDDALQQEPAYASINDHNTDGTSGGNIKTWEQQQQTIIDQSDVPNVIYAELNKPQADSIAFENELIDNQNPPTQEGVQHEDNRLVYAQLAEFKDNEQQPSSTKMPSPYKATEYATIMTPILSIRSKSQENITQI